MRAQHPSFAVALACVTLSACGSSEPTPAPEPEPITVRQARFGDVGADHRVDYPVARFEPGGPFGASIELTGAPTGALALRWLVADRAPVEAEIDLDDPRTRTPEGDATWVAATLPGPLPIGVHQLVVGEGEDAAIFPFEVGPPTDAIASRVREVTTARGATVDFHPVEPGDTFAPVDTVHLTGCGDFGEATWLRAEWRVGEAIDPEGTRTLTLERDTPDTCFAFDFRPHGGWPPGGHEAQLLMNGREVGRYRFTVVGAGDQSPGAGTGG